MASLWSNLADSLSLVLRPESATPLPGAELDWRAWLARSAAYSASQPMGAHHTRAWEWFEGLEPGVEPPALIEPWARGHGKSTTVELAIARQAVRAKRRFALYVSCDQDAANRHVQSVGNTMERVGIERALNKYGFSRGWTGSMLRTANGFNVLAVGLSGGLRGVKLDELRPDIIILDDVDELDDSADAVEKKIRRITQTVLPAGAPGCAVAFLQNPIHANSVMSRLLRGEADMLRNRLQAEPIVAVEGLEWEEYPGEDGRPRYHIIAGTPTWPGKSLAVCEAEMDKFGLVSFLRECQHEVGVGGLFFPDFAETRDGRDWHVCDPFDVPDHWDVWASHDYGTGAPCAFLVYAADERGDVYVIGELYEAGLVSSAQAQGALDLLERLDLASPAQASHRDGLWETDLNLIAFDHANTFPPEKPEERLGEYPVEVWWRRGLPCVRAVKDRKAGWRNLKEWLAAVRYIDGKPTPRLRIFRGAAPNLVRILARAMANPKDPEELDPGFKEDHILDSARYGLHVRPQASKPDPHAPAPADHRPHWMKRTGRYA